MRKLSVNSIKNIAIGAALLGAGGGGNPYIGELMAVSATRKYGEVTLLNVDEVESEALVVPASMMGAPSVQLEKFPNGQEFYKAFDLLEKRLNKKIAATFPIEAGGVNSMIPIMVAAKTGLPLVDVDSMGRALPELQMSTFTLYGHTATPMAIVDEKGNGALLETIDNVWTEKIARSIAVDMGATATVASYPLTGKDLLESGVKGVITLCEKIGEIITNVNSYSTVAQALVALLDLTNGFCFMEAKIVDIKHTTKDGFNFGKVELEGLGNSRNKNGEVEFQNENIIFKLNGEVAITAPDIITFLDIESLNPITNEELKYGKRIYVLGVPCSDKWRTPAGIKLVGPRYFHYDVDYQPVEDLFKKVKELN
ncbi:DUF917 domain-containing protein [Ligilactobacillus sp. WILCCON 0076]|uniref:DUF917 domain-containing protein n=1 Tax=Ligilactobacillus ubinensis TaxID=2876789 RepID=A0A9X2JLP0_9LACO|nr:DUF917 domain-containing protein [Ligilactobacillus ubinensis]MCP0887099.1 DUF917 domain-containing protein [Ligilactobacillus ubinensis]